MRSTPLVAAPIVAALVLMLGLLLGGPPALADPAPDPTSGVDAGSLPVLARESLPLITELTATECPELPPLWVVAQVQAESGWDPALHADGPGGAAGLYQFGPGNWIAAGGAPWASDPPDPADDVLSAPAHLRVAVPWICANLRAVTAHLKQTGKPTAPLDAMLVCHIAGCGRVTGSATGVPVPGEAGCGERCAQVIVRYLAAVHADVRRFAAPDAAVPAAPAPAAPAAPPPAAAPAPAAPDQPAPAPAATVPAAWDGGATGCQPPDPTSSGCLTGATRHGLSSAATAFGGWAHGPVIHAAGCWDAHKWNPSSDHPKGKACDLFAARPGTFAAGAELDAGWRVANWFRANAGPLQVKYVIWHGRYWDPTTGDVDGGWGQRYTGGGVYNVRDATGGHYDHVHVSFRE